MSAGELRDLAAALKSLLVRYDNLWQMSFPYVLTLHQAPTDGGDYRGFHFHIECHPPLRKPHLLKYLAGPEIGGGNFLSDTRPEAKAAELLRAAGRPLQGVRMRDPRALLDADRSTLHARGARRDRGRDRAAAASRRWRPSIATTTGDTIYAIDVVGEADRHALRRGARARARRSCWSPKGCRAAAAAIPDGATRRPPTGWIIVDPIDGTRGLMYQKRSAWILTGVAPNRGAGHVAARHRAGGADRDSAGQAAPVGSAVGGARRRGAGAALQPADRRARADSAAAVDGARRIAHGYATIVALLSRRARRACRASTRRSCSARWVRTPPERRTASRISTPRPAVSCTS